MSAKLSWVESRVVPALESRCSSSVFFSIGSSGEIRSWVESPSTLNSGIIAILALLPLRCLHVILCPLARPKSEPTRPRSGLIAVSRRSRAQRELQRALPRRRHRDRPTPWDRPTCCVDAWSAVCRGQPSLLWWELNVCLVYSYMLDGDFVLSKAHACTSNRIPQIRFPSSPSYLGPKYDGAEGKKKYRIWDYRIWPNTTP